MFEGSERARTEREGERTSGEPNSVSSALGVAVVEANGTQADGVRAFLTTEIVKSRTE